MEHREPPRIAPTERPFDGAAELTGGRFRLRRFDETGDNRTFEYRRAGVLVVVGLALIAGLLYFADRARHGLVEWLGRQPQYQLPFDRIELAPGTPAWYQGGSRAFLERVRLGAGESEHIALLKVAPDHLAVAFKKYAWVEEVARVVFGPDRIRVELRYRRPVAWVQLRGAEQRIVDRNGIILPTEDVDVATLGRVIKISGDGGLAGPSDPRPGVTWKSSDAVSGFDQADERILAASKLAAFLIEAPRVNDAEQYPALHLTEISVTDFRVRGRGLFVFNAEGAVIRWGDAPGDEPIGGPTALEKWAILRHWRETTPSRFLEKGDYWSFSKRGLEHVCPHRRDPHRASEPTTDLRGGGVPVVIKKSPLSG